MKIDIYIEIYMKNNFWYYINNNYHKYKKTDLNIQEFYKNIFSFSYNNKEQNL